MLTLDLFAPLKSVKKILTGQYTLHYSCPPPASPSPHVASVIFYAESMVEGITEDDACDDPVTSTTTDHAATPVGHVTSSPDLVTPCAGSDLETADEVRHK